MALFQSSRTPSPNSSLFQIGEDLFLLLCTWLPIKSISNLDIAISNAYDRSLWLKWLGIIDADSINEYNRHSHGSIRWLVTRGIRTTSIQIIFGYEVSLDADTFSGFGFSSKCSVNDIMIENELVMGGLSIKDCVRVNLRYTNITDVNIGDLARGCPQLHTIYIEKCFALTDESLIQLAQYCPQIHTIDISFSIKITDVGVSALACGCRELRSMSLIGITAISDVSISALASCCPLLNTIKFGMLHWEESITEIGMQALGLNCKCLENVSLHKWTEEDVLAFAVACPQMKNLNLNDRDGLSNHFLSELVIAFPHISISYIYDSDNDNDDNDSNDYNDDESSDHLGNHSVESR